MSGIGHFSAGLIAKPVTPKVPLWILLAASETNDILYFFFSSTGIEPKATFTVDFEYGVRHLALSTNPWSHGLFMSIIWSLVAGLVAFLVYRNKRIASVMGLVVFSHWLLDFLMHSNLPIFFANSPLLGLGLENSGPGFIAMTILDLILIGGGVAAYVIKRRKTITQ
jgi:hypothetical protein